ncbi:MAG: hypothetical protein ACE5I7_08460 [Candidatus Binatia bacterium]
MELHRVGIKFFADEHASVRLPELIPTFHRWIQTNAIPGLPIDVANYSHVHHGPGIMLIAHAGNYALDGANGRLGLLYTHKQPMDGALPERLAFVCRQALHACRLLEEAPELDGRLQFSGAAMHLIANDRLAAPNTEATMAAIRPALSDLLARLYPHTDYALAREPDPRERFAVTITIPGTVTVRTLLQRLQP